MKKNINVIISGGGTGGHIYPAIAIADQIKKERPEANILFVGAENKMEMQKVPKAGYPIKGLWISGLQRKISLQNLMFPFKVMSSLWKSRKIIQEFKPDIAIGTGGFASGPLLFMAAQKGIPTLVQEQNSYPGITNKILSKKAKAICVAYEGLEKYFPSNKMKHTGNPIRSELFQNLPSKKEALAYFGLKESSEKVILSVGGSLGSRTMNNTWKENLDKLGGSQLIWQTGKTDFETLSKEVKLSDNVKMVEFIYDMKMAYAAADIIVSRAGAMAISELELIGKATILLPYPYAAEDHQTQNAMSLVKHQAALVLKDSQAKEQLVPLVMNLVKNENKIKNLSDNLKALGKPNATKDIVNTILNLI